MKNKITFALLTLVLSIPTILAAACSRTSANTPDPSTVSNERVKRGEYLVTIMGCNDCHTPFKLGPNGPEPDMTRRLSGHPEQIGPLPDNPPADPWAWRAVATNTAFNGPWGISYTANLTPDQNTGLGIWTEDMFIRAIRTGKHMGTSRPILPPMPWPMYRNATDEDLKSVYAYLRTIPPVVNHVPDPVIHEPPAAAAGVAEARP